MDKKNKVPQVLKEAIKNDWIKPLPRVAEIDCSDNEVKEALISTLQLIQQYPGIEQLKRKVLKKDDPDYCIVQAEKLLCQCVSGEATEKVFYEINEVLYKALAKLVTD